MFSKIVRCWEEDSGQRRGRDRRTGGQMQGLVFCKISPTVILEVAVIRLCSLPHRPCQSLPTNGPLKHRAHLTREKRIRTYTSYCPEVLLYSPQPRRSRNPVIPSPPSRLNKLHWTTVSTSRRLLNFQSTRENLAGDLMPSIMFEKRRSAKATHARMTRPL